MSWAAQAGRVGARHDSYVCGEGGGGAESGRVTHSGYNAAHGDRADAVDRREKRADGVSRGKGLDLGPHILQPRSQDVKVLADELNLGGVDAGTMPAHRDPRGCDQLLCELVADSTTAVHAESQLFAAGVGKGARGWVLVEERRGALAAQRVHVADELGEAQVNQAAELTHSVVEVL